MIWNRHLTAEQAALLAFELDFLESFVLAEKVSILWDKVKDKRVSVVEARRSPLNALLPKDTPPDWYNKVKFLGPAKDLYNALLSEVEISLSQQLSDSVNKPLLEIVSFEKVKGSDTLDPTTAQISRVRSKDNGSILSV